MLKMYFLRIACMCLISYCAHAANYVVKNAGSAAVNGVYKEAGLLNGKPYYTLGTAGPFGSTQLTWNGTAWQISVPQIPFGSTVYYTNAATTALPPSTGWIASVPYGQAPVPTVIPEPKTLSYSKKVFVEFHENDGSTTDSIIISYNKLGGDAFTGSNGTDLALSSAIEVSQVPAGLKASIVRKSDSTLVFRLIGKATSHVNANDVLNLTLRFSPAAFVKNDTVGMAGSWQANLQVNFRQAFSVAASGANYTTIAAAIAAVTPYDILELAAATFTEAGLIVNKPLIIAGKKAGLTIVQAHAQKATATNRVFEITSSTEVVYFKNLTIRHGNLNLGNAYGGGIQSAAPLEIYNCAISSNIAKSNSGGAANGGGIAAGDLKIFNSLVNDNTVSNGNDAGQVLGGGIGANKLWMVNSTVSGNYASSSGGGIFAYGDATLINSTLTANTSKAIGGGLAVQTGAINLVNTILHGNTGVPAAASDFGFSGGKVNVSHSIITLAGTAANNPTGVPFNGTITHLITGDPLLNALADNGGNTFTHSLKQGSPAIDAGWSGTNVPVQDQVGHLQLGNRDVGAFESPLCGLPSNTFYFAQDTIKAGNATHYELNLPTSKYKEFLWNTGATTSAIDVVVSGWYAVSLKDSLRGCPAHDSVFVKLADVTTSLASEKAFTNTTVYPNPSTGQVFLLHAQGMAEVSDLAGIPVATFHVRTEREAIDLSALPKGMYLIRLTTIASKEQKVVKLMME